jgi:prepilin signal peptidase PulO-like enzyme (type II secretory pathway)
MPPLPPPDPDSGYWLVILYMAALGGCVGSFMNVVVYRLPNRLSLIRPASHCPKCKTPICWYDNVPVFGWLMLLGRCRKCRCWIPMRYPAVEAVTAAMFAALAACGPLTAVEYPWKPVYWFHVMLLCTLLCSALIDLDGNRPPLRLFLPAWAMGIVMPLFVALPWIIGPWTSVSEWDYALIQRVIGDKMETVIEHAAPIRAGIGLAAGVGLGGLLCLLHFVWRKIRPLTEPGVAKPPVGLALDLASVGLFLGWHALCVIGATAVAFHVVLQLPRLVWPKLHIPCGISLVAATFGWMLVWIVFRDSLVWPFGAW